MILLIMAYKDGCLCTRIHADTHTTVNSSRNPVFAEHHLINKRKSFTNFVGLHKKGQVRLELKAVAAINNDVPRDTNQAK